MGKSGSREIIWDAVAISQARSDGGVDYGGGEGGATGPPSGPNPFGFAGDWM